MRLVVALAVMALIGGACSDAASPTSSPTTAIASTSTSVAPITTVPSATTTTFPISHPPVPTTNLWARFALPDDVPATLPFDPAQLNAAFYRSSTDSLVIVITGFDHAVNALRRCGWIRARYGGPEVLTSGSWDEAAWASSENQPWADQDSYGVARCKDEFLQDGKFKPGLRFEDMAEVTYCSGYLVVDSDLIDLDPVAVGAISIELIVDSAAGPVSLVAVPWDAHPGERPSFADLVEIDPTVVSCPQF